MAEAAVAAVSHVRYRGAFGLSFFWHHAVLLGPAPTPGEADERTVIHWTGGDDASSGDKLSNLEAAQVLEVPIAVFLASVASSEHARGDLEVVLYPQEQLCEPGNAPAAQAARARSLVGRRGLFNAVDTDGRAQPGYDPLANNCEHLAVWVITGTARSLQVERVQAIAGALGSVLGDTSASFRAEGRGGSLVVTGPLALAAGLACGVLALSSLGTREASAEACPPADEADRAEQTTWSRPPPIPAARAHSEVLAPPDPHCWSTPVLRSAGTSLHPPFVALPLPALQCGCALNVEVLRPDGSTHAPRRWLCVAERHDALPFGLCFGARLHADALAEASAAPFLALPSFQFAWQRRDGGATIGGLRGVLSSLATPNAALFGIQHVRRNKFMVAGHCAAFPGTQVDQIFHLAAGAEARAGEGVTLTLADYTDEPQDVPLHEGFHLRWVEPGEGGITGRSFPYFACTPEGSVGQIGSARFRFWIRLAAAAAAE